MLDFIIVFGIDYAIGNDENGDMWKLYNYYLKRDGKGTVGIVLQAFIYMFLFFLNAILFYNYLIFIHMNGRVIDLYIRLNGDIDAFFVPKDEEVSLNYLKWVCHKALKMNQRVTNDRKMHLDEKGQPKEVCFIHVYKFEKEKEEDG